MATAKKKNAPQDSPPDNDELIRQVESLKKIVILIIMVSLAVSASFNVYLVRENVALTRSLAEIDDRLTGYSELYQFVQRLVNDLRGLARTNGDVQAVLDNHHEILVANKIFLQPSAPKK